MSKLDLKTAMESLQVRRPLKLQSAQPQFRPPQNEVPISEVAQVEVAQDEVPKVEVAKIELPQNKLTQPELPKKELTQTESPHNEVAKNEVPQNKAAQIKQAIAEQRMESGGYFKLPHESFFDEKLRALSGDEYRLFLWMSSQGWRYRESDGNLRASISYIEIGTGMSHASVSRALKKLQEKNLISLVQLDFKKGNLWHISNKLSQIEVPKNEAPQDEGEANSKRVSSHLKTRQHLPQNEAEIRNTRTLRKKETLSLENIAWVDKYFNSITAPAKRESERSAFLKLKQSNCEADLEKCFAWVKKYGDLTSGTAVHSPMVYLSHTLGEVIEKIHSQTQKMQQIEHQKLLSEQKVNQDRIVEENRAKELAKMVSSFEKAFPNLKEREEYLENFVKTEFRGIRPPREVLINLVAENWVTKEEN